MPIITQEIEVEFEVWCSCGNGLCRQTTNCKGGIEVEPCEKCIEKAKQAGYDDGYDKGFHDGERNINE